MITYLRKEMNINEFRDRIRKIMPQASDAATGACFNWLVDYYANYAPIDPRMLGPHHLIIELIDIYGAANEERRKEIRGIIRGEDK